jgi:hypothetical protein
MTEPGALSKTVFSEILTCSLGRVLEKAPPWRSFVCALSPFAAEA